MWEARTLEVASGKRIQLFQDNSPLSFRGLFSLLERDVEFRQWYSRTLTDCSFEAFFWEHPPFSTDTFDHEAEFVLLNGPPLASIKPEPAPFEPQFESQTRGDVLVFPNLSGDALLIVPRPVGQLEAYPHLAAFLRHGPPTQVQAVWQSVARVVREELSPTPRWLSTAGLGVSWLHLRLDTRPKYYRFEPYKVAA